MECRIKISSLQLTGSIDILPKKYIVFYTCQTNLNKLISLLETKNNNNDKNYNNTQFINCLVQSRLQKENYNDDKCVGSLSNWKIKTNCCHLREGDFSWMSKISHLQNIHLATSELLNWLSTLGGQLNI